MNFNRWTKIALATFSIAVFVPISLPAFQANAEVVEVEEQGDCPGGNEGWQRHLIVDIASKRTYTRCVRVEEVPVTSTTTTPSADAAAPAAPAAPALETVSRVTGATDPYPDIPTGGEVPGTRIWSTSETSWPQFYNNTNSANWRCPAIYGPNGDPYAGESNGLDSGTGKWFRVCVKNPWREPIPKSVVSDYENRKSIAIAEALAKSEAWNAENPGKQKCFEWGPITNPSGGTESGGVCANPTVAPSENSGLDENSGIDASTSITLNETEIEKIAIVSAMTNTKSRTIAAANLLNNFSKAGKENLLNVKLVSTRSAVINISSYIPNIKMVVMASKPGWKPIIFQIKTDNDGNSKIRTKRNLSDFSVTLAANGLKLDTDKAQ